MNDNRTVDTPFPKTNWAGNITYQAVHTHQPTSEDELAQIVKDSHQVKAVGTRHSFTRIADTSGDLVSVGLLNRVIGLDEDRRTVTVEAGITYGALGEYLHRRGYAVSNMPSLPHVCVGGAVQTGTHGSGTGNLASPVVGLRIAMADGRLVDVSRDRNGEQFDGMIIALGMLGVTTQLTLELQDTFQIQQEVYEHVPWKSVLGDYDKMVASTYSLSLFTDWQSDCINLVWFKRQFDTKVIDVLPFEFLSGTRATGKRHPLPTADADFCTDQWSPGPSYERLPHFRADREPSSAGNELQSEYFVHRNDAIPALEAIRKIGPHLKSSLMISEIRTITEDRLWLSPCYQRPSVAIHFTWQPKTAEVNNLLKNFVEPALRPFNPRPHWGKVFMMAPTFVQSQYERLASFRALCHQFDPFGKFHNGYTETRL